MPPSCRQRCRRRYSLSLPPRRCRYCFAAPWRIFAANVSTPYLLFRRLRATLRWADYAGAPLMRMPPSGTLIAKAPGRDFGERAGETRYAQYASRRAFYEGGRACRAVAMRLLAQMPQPMRQRVLARVRARRAVRGVRSSGNDCCTRVLSPLPAAVRAGQLCAQASGACSMRCAAAAFMLSPPMIFIGLIFFHAAADFGCRHFRHARHFAADVSATAIIDFTVFFARRIIAYA